MSSSASHFNSIANHPLFLESEVGESLRAAPIGFIDIGARGGAHEIVEPIAKLTAILGFEPDQAECQQLLQNPSVYEPWAAFCLEPIALANVKSSADLYLLSAATNHSLLPPNAEFTARYNMDKWQIVGKESLQTELLDTVLFSGKLDKYRFGEIMKLDTQGTEFEILQGASRTLDERTVAIVTEVAFCELYKGQKLFSDVELLLRQHGFSFYGFSKLHGRSCKLLDKRNHTTAERAFYADAIFLKDPLPGPSQRRDIDERGLYVLFTAALILGYYDFALELATKTWASSPKSKEKITSLVLDISKLSAANTHHALLEVVNKVDNHPELANILVGDFVDRRRRICNYDDVLNVSALPKKLHTEVSN